MATAILLTFNVEVVSLITLQLDHGHRVLRFGDFEQNLVYILLNRYKTNVTKTKATKAKIRANVNLIRCFLTTCYASFRQLSAIFSHTLGRLDNHMRNRCHTQGIELVKTLSKLRKFFAKFCMVGAIEN